MKQVNDLVKNIGQIAVSEPEKPKKNDEDAMNAINSLFKELLVIYPAYLPTLQKNGLESANDTLNQTKKLWLRTFREKQVTPSMLRFGIKKAELDESQFFPSIGQFLKMCIPTEQDLGIPDVQSAYREACQHTRGKKPEQYSHIIVFEAGRMTGFFDLAGNSENKMLPKFKENYNHLKDKLLRGESITIVENAIEDKSNQNPEDNRTPEQKERDRKQVGASVLDGLRGIF